MPRVIDCHVHHLDDSQVEWAREIGYKKVCLMDWRAEVLKERLNAHPDFVVALGWIPMELDTAVSVAAVEWGARTCPLAPSPPRAAGWPVGPRTRFGIC